MTKPTGPWDREPAKAPPTPARGRLWPWLLFVAALGGVVAALARAYPEALRTGDDWASLGYVALLLVVVASGLSRLRRGDLRRHLRYAAIWAGIVAVLALGLAYREELAGVPRRLQMAFNPGAPVATGDHELVIPQNAEGAFMVVGKVNGQRVRFIVDTGATDTVLSPDDARRVGVDIDGLRFEDTAETANGQGHSAAFAARRLEVGPIGLDDFRMAVNQAPMSSSLLGLSFLNRLESFEFRGRRLVLKWRDAAA